MFICGSFDKSSHVENVAVCQNKGLKLYKRLENTGFWSLVV